MTKSLSDLDVEQIERASEGERAQSYDLRRAGEAHRERADYHRRLIAVGEDLAERHRARLGRLIDGGR